MTLHALRRRSSEYALQVASLALDLRMAADKRETRRTMIDFDVCAVASLRSNSARQHQFCTKYEGDQSQEESRPSSGVLEDLA